MREIPCTRLWPRRLARLGAVALLGAVACAGGFSQSGSSPVHTAMASAHEKLYPIAGTVTDSVSGQPLSGVTLMLYTTPGHAVILQTTVSGDSGQFALDPVPAGKYGLVASRRGHRTAMFNAHETYGSAIVTGEGQDTEHIAFRIDPGATIHGHVTDDSGEPVEAHVLLMYKTGSGGLGEHLVKSISGQTDDTGLFEYWNLEPGTYYLAVNASPWFALHSRSSDLTPEQRQATAPLDVAYPVTYYDGATDEAAAAPILVKSRDRLELNVALHSVPALHLTLHLPTQPAHPEMSPAWLRQTVFGEEDFGARAVAVQSPQNSDAPFEFTGIAPGHYTLTEGHPPQVTEIDASGNQDLDVSSAIPSFPVDLMVKMADGSDPPGTLQMVLMSDDLVQRRLIAGVSKPKAHFGAVPPGRWVLLAQRSDPEPTEVPGTFAVTAIQFGANVSTDSRIEMKKSALSFTVTVAEGKTMIDGFATSEGKGVPGVMIVLVPKNPGGSLAQFRRDQSDSDGSFTLLNVVPGDYTIVAIEDGWGLDWAQPAVIARYIRGGTPVTVTLKSGLKMRLDRPVNIQPR